MSLQFGENEKDDAVARDEQRSNNAEHQRTTNTEQRARGRNNDGHTSNGKTVYRGGNRMIGDGTPSQILGRTFQPNTNDAVVDGLAKKLNEQMKEQVFPDGAISKDTLFRAVSAYRIDEEISSVMASLEFTVGGKRYLAARIILCYMGDGIKRKRTTRVKGEVIEIPVRAADAANQDYWDKAIEATHPTLAANTEILSAGMETITADFDINNIDAIQTLIGSTISSIEDTIEPVHNGNFLNGVAVANEGYVTKVTPIISDDQFYNTTAQPIRGDIQLPWVSCAAGNGRYSNDGKEVEFGRVMGYIDLEPLPVQNTRFRSRRDEDAPCYDALMVITFCGSVSPYGANTLETFMNILSGAFIATDNQFWQNCYQPAIDGVNSMRALAGLGYNTPEGKPFDDMDSASTSQRDVQDMLDVLLSKPKGLDIPTPAFAIDLDPSQDKSGVVSTLLAAANGDREANAQVIEAIDNYFDGRFLGDGSKDNPGYWKSKQERVLFDTGVMITIGEWTDTQGIKRDVREWDTQALLNTLQGDQEIFWDYMDTFDPNNGDPMLLMLQRERLLNSFLGGKVNGTSYAFRAVFNADLFVAMNECAEDLAIAPTVEGVGFETGHRYTSYASGRQVSSVARASRRRRRGADDRDRSRAGFRETSSYGFRGRNRR